MNDSMFYWLVEGLGKAAAWLALCLVVSGWARRRGLRLWRTAWLVLGGMSFLSLAPAVWHWTWAEPTRRVLEAVEVSVAPTVSSERALASTVSDAVPDTVVGVAGEPDWTWRQWMVAVWLAGAAASAGWLAWGFWTAERWRRAAVPLCDTSWQEALETEAAVLGCRRAPTLAVHPVAPTPCLVGVGGTRAILLPPECRDWDMETRRVVLRHELAHACGHDDLFALLRSLVLAMHWANPLAWLAAVRDRREQELAADRRVLASGVSPESYAALLLRLARPQTTSLVPAACHSMARLSHLEGRFQAILRGGGTAARPRWWWRGLTALGATAVAVGAGCSSYRGTGDSWIELPGPRVPRVPVLATDLEAQLGQAASKAKLIKVKFRVVDGSGQLSKVQMARMPGELEGLRITSLSGSIAVPLGQPGRGHWHVLREFVYPTAFEFPDPIQEGTPGPGGSFPVTPTTPTAFETKNTGWKIEGLAVEPQAAFFVVRGRFVETTFDGFVQGAGEAFSPIVAPATTALGTPTTVVLSENKVEQPTFTTRETPFIVSALPDKPYTVRLNLKQPGCFLEIRVTPAAFR